MGAMKAEGMGLMDETGRKLSKWAYAVESFRGREIGATKPITRGYQ